jgi:hypothetical protein
MNEEKNTITIAEFKSWLMGLMCGKKGSLPDIEDWKVIKQMLDKVEENEKCVSMPHISMPYIQKHNGPEVSDGEPIKITYTYSGCVW